jgi:MraZ protein
VALFLSTFRNRIDKKGRVSVPATFRAALGTQSFAGVVVYPAITDAYSALEGCGMDRMEQLKASIDRLDLYSEEHDAFASAIFGGARQLPFDPEGRIMLPEELIAYAGIGEEASFVGMGATFQIWAPGAFQVHQAAALQKLRAERRGLRLFRGPAEEGGGGHG